MKYTKFKNTSRDKRFTYLENLKTGKKIRTNSIAGFCRKAKLNGNDRYHITPVLDGDRFHHKNWYDPKFLDKKINLKDIYNNKYPTLTVRQILKNGLLGACTLKNLLNKKLKSAYGLALEETEFEEIGPRNYKISNIKIKKLNKIYSGTINELSKQKVLNTKDSYDLVYGFKERSGGAELIAFKIEKKSALNNNLKVNKFRPIKK